MSPTPSFSSPISSPAAPITTVAEADELIRHMVEAMNALVDIVQQETEHVRAGRLAQARLLEKPKGELACVYIADTLRLRANHTRVSGLVSVDKADALRRRHDSFRELLQINLTVLATAHSVSEGIVRGVSEAITRKSTPQTYGATGRTSAPSRTGAPLSVSRKL
jgi:flagellar biosynthesis/type III secretory pathway chaperone